MNKIAFILTIGICLTLIGCKENEKKLFWISEPDGHNNDFIFMVESTNVLPISRDSIIYYLTSEELLSAEKLVFKDYGSIYQNDAFKAHVLLRIGSNYGRDYKFLLRTYRHNFTVIDTYEFAIWSDSKKHFCFGSVNDKLIITKLCNDNSVKLVTKINNDGKIVTTPN